MLHGRRKNLPTSVLAIMGVISCGALGTGTTTASAATNGQQIRYSFDAATSQCTVGKNQNNVSTERCTVFQLRRVSYDYGWWWVGDVTITWFRPGGSVNSSCRIPRQHDGDFVTCSEPTIDSTTRCTSARPCMRPAPSRSNECPNGQELQWNVGFPFTWFGCGSPGQSEENNPDVPEEAP